MTPEKTHLTDKISGPRSPKKFDGRKISRKLNLKQRRFVAHFTNPQDPAFGNQSRAAVAAGYPPSRAPQTGYEVVNKSDVRTEIERVMDAAGVTREKVAEALKGGLEAGLTRVFCEKGEVIYSDPLADHPTRVRTAEVVSKLRGDFPPIKATVDVKGLGELPDILAAARARAQGKK